MDGMYEIGQKIAEYSVYIVGFLVGLSVALWKLVSKRWGAKQSNKFNVAVYTKLNNLIANRLSELRIALKCARVSISRFHNGGHYFDGEHILRFSTSHESVAMNIDPISDISQGSIVSKYLDLILQLQKSDIEPEVVEIEDLPISPYRIKLQNRGTKAFIILPIKDSYHLNLVGYMLCEWINTDVLDDSIDVKSLTTKYVAIISSLLNEKDAIQDYVSDQGNNGS